MKARNMAKCALFAALLTVCGWIALPFGDVAFTLQTFGVFLSLGLLGGKWGTAAISVYLVMGAVGLPVFSGFRGGAGILLGATGGYLSGFLACGFVYGLVTVWLKGKWAQPLAMVLGLLICYGFGTAWFYFGYAGGGGIGLGAVILKCVVPYILPDCAKIALAHILSRRLKRFV